MTGRDEAIGTILEFVLGMQRRLRRVGLPPVGETRLNRSQVDALFLLAHSRREVTPGRLAGALGVTAGAVSQLVDGLRAAGLVVTVVRPRALNDAPLRTDYVEDRDGPSRGGYSVSRASVAHLMLKAVADSSYENASVAVGNPKK